MIVVNRCWLAGIGMPLSVVVALQETRGLMLSTLGCFAEGFAGSRFACALSAETEPRTLTLVGMSDRHGAAGVCSTIELCTATSRATWRSPSESERRILLAMLEEIDHPTARAIIAAIHEAP